MRFQSFPFTSRTPDSSRRLRRIVSNFCIISKNEISWISYGNKLFNYIWVVSFENLHRILNIFWCWCRWYFSARYKRRQNFTRKSLHYDREQSADWRRRIIASFCNIRLMKYEMRKNRQSIRYTCECNFASERVEQSGGSSCPYIYILRASIHECTRRSFAHAATLWRN